MRHFFTRVSSVLNTLLLGLSFLLTSTLAFSQQAFFWSAQEMNTCYCSHGRCGSLIANPGFNDPIADSIGAVTVDVGCWHPVNGGSPHILSRNAPGGQGYPNTYHSIPFVGTGLVGDNFLTHQVNTWDSLPSNLQMVCMAGRGEQVETQLLQPIFPSSNPANWAILDFWYYAGNFDATYTASHETKIDCGLSSNMLLNVNTNWAFNQLGTIGYLSTRSDNCDDCRLRWIHVQEPIAYTSGPALNFLRISPREQVAWYAIDDVNVFIPHQNQPLVTTGNLQICANDVSEFAQVSVDPGLRCPLVWSSSDGVYQTDASHFNVHPSVTTTYTVSTSDPCYADMSFTVDLLEVQLAIADQSVCAGSLLSIELPSSSLTYSIVPSQGATISGNSLTILTDQTSDYTLTATDVNGCVASDLFTVNLMPLPVFTAIASPNPLCIGLTGAIVADNPDLTYQWSGADIVGSSAGLSISVNPVTNETYQAIGTDQNGCYASNSIELSVENACCSNLPPTSYLLTGYNHWTNQSLEFDQDLVLSPSAVLVADNCTLKFAQGVGIKMNSSSQLTLAGCEAKLLDNCEGFWKGIYAIQDGSAYSTNVGSAILTLKTSTIENANVGIDLMTTGTATAQFLNPWMRVLADGSKFNNNYRDVKFQGPNGTLGMFVKSQFIACEFTTDQDFPTTLIPFPVRVDVKRLLSTTMIKNSRFINSNSAFLTGVNSEFIAIQSANASLAVVATATNNDGVNSGARILGYTRAISATGAMNLSIQGVDFQNWRSVYTRMKGRIKITDSEFYNLTQAQTDNGQIYAHGLGIIPTDGTADISAAPYGLYIDQSLSSYIVYDNLFKTTLPGGLLATAHGAIVNGTGSGANLIRSNRFYSCNYGLKIQGVNCNLNQSTGIKYSCNSFLGNSFDINEKNSSLNASQIASVADQFSSGLRDPNNVFSSDPNTWVFDDIDNNSLPHQYKKMSPLPNVNPSSTECIQVLISSGASTLDPCMGISGIIPSSTPSHSDLIIGKETLDMAYFETHNLYTSLIDNGNTELLRSQVESVNFFNALQTYYKLLENSPYLSEEVLLAALKNYSLPNYLIVQILASNPFASKSGRIRTVIDERLIPFEDFEQALILEGLSTLSNKEYLEDLMITQQYERDFIIGELCFLHDTIDSMNPYLGNKSYLDSKKFELDLVPMLVNLEGIGDFSTIETTISEFQQNFKLDTDRQESLNDMAQLFQIASGVRFSSNQVLDAEQTQFLEKCAKASSVELVSMSLDLLIDNGGYEYDAPILDADGTLRRFQNPESSYLKADVKIFPNPAVGFINVDLGEVRVNAYSIMNVTGQILLQGKLNEGNRFHQIALDDISNGPYEISFTLLNGKKSKSQSLMIIK
jgi:hypothetical protein